jgi:pre-mRNA-splicing factor ATP-dependent RNA helicase DHX15/PRP43
VYNPRLGVESLLVSPISKASAKQRSGRAGRTKPGQCYRLYTEASFDNELIQESYPEILRSNLANLIIQLKKLGINDLVHFDFLDPPSPETLMRGLEELFFLGALDEDGNLSELGKCISEIPMEPRLAKTLLSSSKVMDEMLICASMLSVPNVFVRPWDRQKYADSIKKKFSHPESDHISLINVYRAYKAHNENQTWCKTNFINFRAV